MSVYVCGIVGDQLLHQLGGTGHHRGVRQLQRQTRADPPHGLYLPRAQLHGDRHSRAQGQTDNAIFSVFPAVKRNFLIHSYIHTYIHPYGAIHIVTFVGYLEFVSPQILYF